MNSCHLRRCSLALRLTWDEDDEVRDVRTTRLLTSPRGTRYIIRRGEYGIEVAGQTHCAPLDAGRIAGPAWLGYPEKYQDRRGKQ